MIGYVFIAVGVLSLLISAAYAGVFGPVVPGLLPAHWATYLGQIAAAGAALGGVYRYVLRPVIRLTRKISAMYDKVEGLVAQFERNGGSSVRDALDRIEASMVVQDSRQKILLGLAPFAVVETDETGEVVFVNRTYRMWTGLSDQEAKGEGWVNAIDPSDQERVRRDWADAVAGGRVYEGRFKMVDGRGGHYDVFARAYPMLDPSNGHVPPVPGGWLAIIYKCAADVCCQNPDMCPFANSTGVCRAGDHTSGSQLKPVKFQSLNPTRRQ